ncbi:MAG: Trm112 family protein [Phycisphaeraceae bacterium]|nr:Trm112 family protein [Phycisphaeraceae bacterium]
MLDADLLSILVCPVTRSALKQEGDWLVGTVGGLRYPIRDGIPVLLADEATLPQGCASLDEFKKKFVPRES